jgi:hypothetical protein
MTAKIKELAIWIEQLVPDADELHKINVSALNVYTSGKSQYRKLSDMLTDIYAQRFQGIALAAGAIRELCEREAAKIKAQSEVMKNG